MQWQEDARLRGLYHSVGAQQWQSGEIRELFAAGQGQIEAQLGGFLVWQQ